MLETAVDRPTVKMMNTGHLTGLSLYKVNKSQKAYKVTRYKKVSTTTKSMFCECGGLVHIVSVIYNEICINRTQELISASKPVSSSTSSKLCFLAINFN